MESLRFRIQRALTSSFPEMTVLVLCTLAVSDYIVGIYVGTNRDLPVIAIVICESPHTRTHTLNQTCTYMYIHSCTQRRSDDHSHVLVYSQLVSN